MKSEGAWVAKLFESVMLDFGSGNEVGVLGVLALCWALCSAWSSLGILSPFHSVPPLSLST